MKKLSELDGNEMVIHGENVMTVDELKKDIIDWSKEDYEKTIYLAVEERLTPSAVDMLNEYLERIYEDKFEDSYDTVENDMTDELINKLQSVLDEEFHGSMWYEYGEKIQVDVKEARK